MAKKRRGTGPSWKVDRELIAMAATNATVEEAAAELSTSAETIQRKAKRLGISIKNGRLTKRGSPSRVELGLKGKPKG